jgi:hypothetical protein
MVIAVLTVAAAAGARGTWSPCGLSMISAINPLSERSRGYRYWLTTLWFLAGALAGGAVLGAGSAVLAWLLHPLLALGALSPILAVLCCLIALASDRRLAGWQLPLHPRQVNELWLMRYRRWLYASGFGAQIGTGFATYIMTAATYLLVALAGLTGSPARALLAGLVFGLVRGLAVLLSAPCRTPQALRELHARLDAWQPWSLRAVMAVEILGACWLAGVAGGIPVAVATAGLAATILLVNNRPAQQSCAPVAHELGIKQAANS